MSSFSRFKNQINTFTNIINTEKSKHNKNEAKIRQAAYVEYYNKSKINPHAVLYESYMGRGMICNPYAIFKTFKSRSDFNKYDHYWVFEDMEDNKKVIEEYASYDNVHFISRSDDEYLKQLASAKYLINNVTFPPLYTPKEGQIYVNTWHGIPLKTLGFDLPDGNVETRNTIKNFLSSDYLISPSEFMTTIYKQAFKLDGIYQGNIIQEGQPRNDNLFNTNRNDIINKLISYGVNVDPNKKIIMYAPTWKGGDYGNPDIGLEEYFNFIDTLESNINTDEYQVLVKPHQIVYKHIKNNKNITSQFIPAIIDTNEILSVVDILVSDYSSIYFDFLATGRPILFYIPDLEEYQKYRGLYHSIDTLPGPKTKIMADIPKWINNLESVIETYKSIYHEQKTSCCQYDDGNVCGRLLDILLENNNSPYHIISDMVTEKKKVVIFGSDLKPNGITQSLLSLLNIIDHDKFDITLLTLLNKSINNTPIINSVNKQVRVITKVAGANSSLNDDIRYKLIMEKGIENSLWDKIAPKSYFRREFKRIFGNSRFDYAIDFTGYSAHHATLFAFSDIPKKYIWQHNDLIKDRFRKVNGQMPLNKGLKVVFSTYPYYDKLVSCSKSVMDVNRKSLSTSKIKDKFTFARNTVHYERIQEALMQPSFLKVQGKDYYIKCINENLDNQKINMDIMEMPDSDCTVFVTMGRLSPEKNHANLITAFKKFHQEYQNTKLYILGAGPLMDDLTNQIVSLGLTDSVVLTGNLNNPFSFVKQCNCFILPSNYEGQPMVIQEARVLEIPIILSDFSTGKDTYIENGQLVIKKDSESIYSGFKAYMENRVPQYSFDPHEYNLSVYKEFEQLFD